MRVRDHACEFLVEAVAVVEAGQRIALGKIDQLVGGLALPRYVLEQPQVADRAAVDVLHRVHLLRNEAAVRHLQLQRALNLPLLGQSQHAPALLFRPRQRRRGGGERLLRVGADQPRARRNHPDAGERGIAVHHLVVAGYEQDAGVHRGQQRRQPRVLVLRARQIVLLHGLRLAQFDHGGLQPLLGLLALGDVADADADAEVTAAAIVDRAPVGRRPEFGAALAPAEKFVVLAGIAAQRAVDLPHGARGVGFGNARRRETRHGQALLRRIAEHVEHARIDPDELPLRIDPAFAVVAVVGDGGELGLALRQRLEAALQRVGHHVVGMRELAHLAAVFHRQPHVEIARRQALARPGKLREAAGQPVRQRDHRNDGEDQRQRPDREVLADQVFARGAHECRGQAEMQAPHLDAAGLDVHGGVKVHRLPRERRVGRNIQRRQRNGALPAGARHQLLVVVEQHQVGDAAVGAHPLQDLGQRPVLAPGERAGERRVEQLLLLLEMDLRALVELFVHDADAIDDQQRQHHHLHQRARQQQPRTQRHRGRHDFHGMAAYTRFTSTTERRW